MNLRMLLQDNYGQGVEDAEARAEAKAKKEKACSIKSMYADNVPIAKICQYFSLSEDEVQSIISAK